MTITDVEVEVNFGSNPWKQLLVNLGAQNNFEATMLFILLLLCDIDMLMLP